MILYSQVIEGMENSSTKKRIIESAITLFNDKGIANVRLTQISDEAGISVGNLAYHFKNKEAIVEAVYSQLIEEFAEVLSGYMSESSLSDFDNQLTSFYGFFKHNRFYIFNIFEIEQSYPAIHQRWQRYIAKMITQLRKRLDYMVDAGSLLKETQDSNYDLLAQTIWITITFWLPQQIIRGKASKPEMYRKAIWALLYPYLTAKGKEEYNQIIKPMIGHS